MRHLKRNAKLGRKGAHRNAMLANMVCSLIKHKRVTTTLAKAKAVRPVVEKMVTLGKKGGIHHRRLAVSRLHQEDAVRILFNEIAPQHQDRPGGYTRIIKLMDRRGDAAPMAIIEFVEAGDAAVATADDRGEKKETAPIAATETSTENKTPDAKPEAVKEEEDVPAAADGEDKKES
jgi:large subunit ribosomal protein L17